MREKQLILYKNVPHEDILVDMVYLYEKYILLKEKKEPTEADQNLLYDVVGRILDLSGNHGFFGNLWHCYLTYILTGHENVYSIPCVAVARATVGENARCRAAIVGQLGHLTAALRVNDHLCFGV